MSKTTNKKQRFTEQRFPSFDGLSLYYRDYHPDQTNGLPLLCLGGLTRNSKDFHAFARYFQDRGHRVICPDYRGRGQSDYDPDPNHYRPETYWHDLHHLTVAAQIGPFVAIGTSLGGILITGIAVGLPGLLRGAVINDVGPEFDAVGIKNIVAYVSRSKSLPSLEEAVQYTKETFPDLPAVTEAHWEAIARATYKESADGHWVPDWDPNIAIPIADADGPDRDLWPLFASLGQRPCLILRGANSDVLTAETFQNMQKRLGQFTYLEVPDVGHAPALVDPRVLPAIDDIISRAQT